MKVKFKISEEKFFNNGKVILNSMPEIKNGILKALSQEEIISEMSRKSKGKPEYNGINATSLNQALRRCLDLEVFKGETHVESGIFFHKTKEGFDFSSYDEKYNISRLYNYYQGSIGILDGDKKIEDLYEKLDYGKEEWLEIIKTISTKTPYNSDYIVDKEKLTVVGELQFGNWALIYRDLFRLLNADSNAGIDFYIYITADDDLSKLLSAQTVSYKKAVKVIEENLSIIKTPVWLIGLGIEKI